MRKKEEIIADDVAKGPEIRTGLILEIMLDIRSLLIGLLQEQRKHNEKP